MSPTTLFPDLSKIRRPYRMAMLSGAAGLALASTAAQADCTADSSGLVVSCTGASTGYSNLSTGVSLSADSTAAITGPILLGNSAGVNNAGSMTSSTTAPLLQVGSSSAIVNGGTISLTSSGSGSPAVLMGDNGIFTNNGSLSATVGTPVIQFGQGGTFINNTAATAAVGGDIYFGPNVGGGTSTLSNFNTAFGITGNIFSIGNTSIDNAGLITGRISQTATGGTVAITNEIGGTFTGSLSTGDVTNLVNNGTMSLSTTSALGSARLGVSNFTNNGTLNVGTTVPVQLVVNGAFVNGASSVLSMAVHSNGSSAPVAGTSYSQIYAAGSNGTATLGGTLNIVPTAGFYQSGSTYNLILADQSITGTFASVNGSTLPFISFVPVGIVAIGTQEAFQVMAVRSTTYANAIASVATPSQLVIAQALEPLVAVANADPTSTAATLIGEIDLLTIPQTQTLLDQINPAAYLSYSQALIDQMNLFNRQVMLRTLDPRNDQMPAGWWGDVSGQTHLGKTSLDNTRQSIFGLTVGFDLGGPHWLVGAAVGFSSASLSNGLVSLKGHNNAYMFGGYGSYRAGPFVATAQVDYDTGAISTTKTVSVAYTSTTTAATSTTAATTTTTPTNLTITAEPGDHLLKASGTVGIDLNTGLMKITPFAGADYARGAINGFTEAGGDAADLTVARLSIDRTDLLAGVNVTTSEGNFRPYVRAAYRSQIGGSRTAAVSAYFDGDPATTFTVDGATNRHEVDIDAGVNVVYDDGSFFLGYQGTIRNQMSDHGVHAGIRLDF